MNYIHLSFKCKHMVTEVTADNEIEEEYTSFLLLP